MSHRGAAVFHATITVVYQKIYIIIRMRKMCIIYSSKGALILFPRNRTPYEKS